MTGSPNAFDGGRSQLYGNFDPAILDATILSLERGLDTGGEELLAREIAMLEAEHDDGFPVAVEARVVNGHSGVEIIKAANDARRGRDEAHVVPMDR